METIDIDVSMLTVFSNWLAITFEMVSHFLGEYFHPVVLRDKGSVVEDFVQ